MRSPRRPNPRRPRERGIVSLPVSVLMIALGLAGCNDLPGRRQFHPLPSPVPGTGGTLVLEGPASIEPGTSARFTATLVDPAGARRDVTREALWSARGSGIAFAEPGVATAPDVGYAKIFASYGLAYADTTLTAKPAGTFIVRGQISPLLVEAPGQIEVVEGTASGRTAEADAFGEYLLIGVAGTMRLRASMLDHQPVERTISVSSDMQVDFRLVQIVSFDATGRWRLTVTAAAECGVATREASATIDLLRDPPPAFTYKLTVPAVPGSASLRARIVGNAFTADLYWGDLEWSSNAWGVPLGDAAEVLGSAFGEQAGGRITGGVSGTFTDRRTQPHVDCEGVHAFELRREAP